MKTLKPADLKSLAVAILVGAGSSAAEADIVADHLVESNLKGHDSHGVGMIPTYVQNVKKGALRPNREGRIVTDAGPILVCDGERGYGQVIARRATALGMAKAKQFGVALVALRDSHHIGRIGTYGEQCAAEGLVGILFVNGRGHNPRVAPHGGADARLATNPLAISVPGTAKTPSFAFDMATSKVAMGKMRVARNKGEEVEPGLIIDAGGKASIDPRVMYGSPPGSLLPIGEHKGYGLGLACEILAGVIAGSGTGHPGNERHGGSMNGMLLIVIDPAQVTDPAWTTAEYDAIVDYVTASPPVDPEQPVMIAGDPERRHAGARLSGIPIDDESYAQLIAAGKSVDADLTGFDV